MTTAFTAMPMKMTMSAMRFLGDDMGKFYPVAGAPYIDPHQVERN